LIEYIVMNEQGLDSIQTLWEKLNEHHKNKTVYFAQRFANYQFEQRKAKILQKSKTARIRIDLAKDSEKDNIIAYCISSVDSEGIGEVISIFVDTGYRKLGVGGVLMERTIGWMEKLSVKSKRIDVVYGNEEALPFYEKFGFFPQLLVLEQKK